MDLCIKQKDGWYEVPSEIISDQDALWEAVALGDPQGIGDQLRVEAVILVEGKYTVDIVDRESATEDEEEDEYLGPVELRIVKEPDNGLTSDSTFRVWIKLPLKG